MHVVTSQLNETSRPIAIWTLEMNEHFERRGYMEMQLLTS